MCYTIFLFFFFVFLIVIRSIVVYFSLISVCCLHIAPWRHTFLMYCCAAASAVATNFPAISLSFVQCLSTRASSKTVEKLPAACARMMIICNRATYFISYYNIYRCNVHFVRIVVVGSVTAWLCALSTQRVRCAPKSTSTKLNCEVYTWESSESGVFFSSQIYNVAPRIRTRSIQNEIIACKTKTEM